MSKKEKKQETQIIDQQKEPCLRALQKKVRNINKKLNQITELLKRKQPLKPEQQEKVNRQDQLLEQRAKYLEFIDVYRTLVVENEKPIRRAQLSELEDLAGIITAREYGADLGKIQNQAVDNLIKVLTQGKYQNLTLKERVEEISGALMESANHKKLKESISVFLANNEERRPNIEVISHQPQPLSPKSQEQRKKQMKEMDEFEEKEEKVEESVQKQLKLSVNAQMPQNMEIPFVEPMRTHSAPHQDNVEQPVDQIIKQVENIPNNPEANIQEKEKEGEKKEKEGEKESEKKEGEKKEKFHWRRERRENNKKTFKPKYEQKQQNPNQATSSSSSLEQSPKARSFKQEEIKELIENGFIVIGKPKVKAKDQKSYYDHEHGKKNHHRHSKKNY